MAAADWDGAVELYADDPRFQWVEDGRVAYTSREEIRAALAGVEGAFSETSTTFHPARITPLRPGLAHVVVGYAQRYGAEGAPGSFAFSGMVSALATHTPDGWRFLAGHSSTRRPDRGG